SPSCSRPAPASAMTKSTTDYDHIPLCHTHPGVAELLAYDASLRSLWPGLSQWMMISLGWCLLIPGYDAIKILSMMSAAGVSIICLFIWNSTRKRYQQARRQEEFLQREQPQDTTQAHIRNHISRLTQKLRRYTFINGFYSIAYSLISTCLYLENADIIHLDETVYLPSLLIVLSSPVVFFPRESFLFILLVVCPLWIIGPDPDEYFFYRLLGALLIPGLLFIFARQAFFTATTFGGKFMLCFGLAIIPWTIPLALLLPLYLKYSGDSTYTVSTAQPKPTWARRLFTHTAPPSPFPWKNKLRRANTCILSILFFLMVLCAFVGSLCKPICPL
ncbi:MAG: hypothetical protein II349_02860, partial [Akkermansia sp.]|nr:hypothetical protein [Akkermansia sp.]